MSIWWGIETDESSRHFGRQLWEGGKCFYCHRVLGFPAIEWMGAEEIFLHPECAVALAHGLLQDWKNIHDGLDAWKRAEESRRTAHTKLVIAESEVKSLHEQIAGLTAQLEEAERRLESEQEALPQCMRTGKSSFNSASGTRSWRNNRRTQCS